MVRWQKQNEQRLIASATAAGLHALAVVLLLQYAPVRSALIQAAPVMVSLIAPPQIVEKPQQPPKPLPVKAKAQRPEPAEPRPLITAASEAPAPVTAPAPAPQLLAPVEGSPPPPSAARTAAPVPFVPPNFNAAYLDNPPPPYPALARRMGEQGKLVLRVLVNVKGTADKVELKSGSGSTRLDNTALETVRRWRFIPARQGSEAVPAWVLIPITFTLEG